MESPIQSYATRSLTGDGGLSDLPDEIVHNVCCQLDIPDLLSLSRTSQRLRLLALDPLLHHRRLRHSSHSLDRLLPQRPLLATIQPPTSSIYLSRTHSAARKLHWSLVCIRLNRSLSRRPLVTALVSANILPRECCRRDRASGQYLVSLGSFERGGLVVERKKKVERERVKDGLRVWLERKAGEILRRRKEGGGIGVGILVWRFSRRMHIRDGSEKRTTQLEGLEGGVKDMKKFWEGIAGRDVKASRA